MCGIVGYIGKQDALPIIVAGLEKLEYRGYDSAGVAVFENGDVKVTRAQGKLSELKKIIAGLDRHGKASIGIGHTRWATHGRPSEINAHPHRAGRVSLVHNGIIENYLELKQKLGKSGAAFKSETDTEVVSHLLNFHLESGLKPFDALKATCKELHGSYAFVAFDSQHPDRLLIAKNATPIIIGLAGSEILVASDIPAVLNHTRDIIVLEDGDLAEVQVDKIQIEHNGDRIERKKQTVTWDAITAQKGGYKHFMLKEIHEQSQVITDTFRGRIGDDKILLSELNLTSAQIKGLKRVTLLACGTAWHACLIAKYYIENLARIPCEVDYAHEYRYRNPILEKDTLVIAVSQSGETADTLAALELAKSGAQTAAICNVLGSSIARKAGSVMFTRAGPEISVASTKAFTTQVVAAYLLALHIGQERGVLSAAQVTERLKDLLHLPALVDRALHVEKQIEDIAPKFGHCSNFIFIGRGLCYPVALEGALKLKEISYIHAEGFAAAELKHGSIALIDENMPVVVLMQKNELFQKTLSNLKEVEARGGRILCFSDTTDATELQRISEVFVGLPQTSDLLSPVLFTLPLQLLAYYIAVFKGTDVDQPRNLAKSVTVE